MFSWVVACCVTTPSFSSGMILLKSLIVPILSKLEINYMDYKIYLQGKQEVAKDTMSFYFSKPDGFVCEAGQYME
jgi:hypothetical protein